MSSLDLYTLLAQSINLYGAGPWVFTLSLDDGSQVVLAEATQEMSIRCMALSSPGDSMTSVWVVNHQGCVVFPEVSLSSDVQDLAESIAIHGFPQWYANGAVAACAALSGPRSAQLINYWSVLDSQPA